mgnify:FL=1
MDNHTCCSSHNSCDNGKSELVLEFIELLKKEKENLSGFSERQKELYNNYIRDLELSPCNITMREVLERHITTENYMSCDCSGGQELDECQKVLAKLWAELRHYIHKEIAYYKTHNKYAQNPPKTQTYCWDYNAHFCPKCKKVYDKTIEYGLMNEDYSWKSTTTKSQIAEWVCLYSYHFNISKKWEWAEKLWGLKNLSQRNYENGGIKDNSKLDIVKKIFKDSEIVTKT